MDARRRFLIVRVFLSVRVLHNIIYNDYTVHRATNVLPNKGKKLCVYVICIYVYCSICTPHAYILLLQRISVFFVFLYNNTHIAKNRKTGIPFQKL